MKRLLEIIGAVVSALVIIGFLEKKIRRKKDRDVRNILSNRKYIQVPREKIRNS